MEFYCSLIFLDLSFNGPVNDASNIKELIEDETELIEDMFSRYGNLINIDELYLFQPNNVNNKTLSTFKRKT